MKNGEVMIERLREELRKKGKQNEDLALQNERLSEKLRLKDVELKRHAMMLKDIERSSIPE